MPTSTTSPWVMPAWMERYREMIRNTGGNPVEELVSDTTDARVNLPRAMLSACVQSQVGLLVGLHAAGMLAPPAAPEPPSAIARIVTLCQHCGEPMPDDEVGVCPDHVLDTATAGTTRTTHLGPHEPDPESKALVCECGASCDTWQYDEDYYTWRTVRGFENGVLKVEGSFEWGEGNGTPGLVCENGCRRPINLPADIEIDWT